MAKHYKIKLSALFLFTVSATEWNQAVARGWIIPRNAHVAVLAEGVVARATKRTLTLRDTNWNELFVLTSSMLIDAKAPIPAALRDTASGTTEVRNATNHSR